MDILICFKTVADLDQVPEADWAAGADSGVFDFRGYKTILDPLAEGALELALRFRDEAASADRTATLDNEAAPAERPATLDAVTALPPGEVKPAERMLRTLTALGYEHTAMITDAPITPFTPDVTAKVLASYIQSRPSPDLILLGACSADGGTGMTGPLLASELGLPCITEVTAFRPCESNRVTVTYQRAGSQITETVSTPLVLTVGDVPGALLRVPTLRQRKAAADAAPEAPACAALCPDPGSARIQSGGFSLIDQSRSGHLIEGKNAAEKAAALYDEYLKTEVAE